MGRGRGHQHTSAERHSHRCNDFSQHTKNKAAISTTTMFASLCLGVVSGKATNPKLSAVRFITNGIAITADSQRKRVGVRQQQRKPCASQLDNQRRQWPASRYDRADNSSAMGLLRQNWCCPAWEAYQRCISPPTPEEGWTSGSQARRKHQSR